MDTLLHIIEAYGLWVVFICVLLDQGGLPVPAYPAMIVTSALAIDAQESIFPILIVATLASLIADFLWFQGGRRFGAALLRLMCKLSLSPDSCVGQTRRIYSRWGAPSLIAAKFIPGFAALATTLAGQSGTSARRFVFFDGIGAALWAGGAITLGVVFHSAVNEVLEELEDLGRYALVVLIGVVIAFAASKWWKRRQFLAANRMERISIDELKALIDGGSSPAILDVRTPEQREHYGWIAGDQPARDVTDLPISTDAEVVVYCDCPNEASATVFARKLKAQGFVRVRPLAGGLEAWRAKGYPVNQATAANVAPVATLEVRSLS
jgi:membrane protein DedA with SNARE-associated domain/rhodanese-related sulfurtransferase